MTDPTLLDAESDGARAGLGGTLVPGDRPAVLVVDPVRAYTDPDSPLYFADVDTVVGPMRDVVAAAHDAGIPVVFTRVIHAGPGNGGVLARKMSATQCFVEGSPWADPIDGLAADPGRDVLITKEYPSAFFGTSLASLLRQWRVDTLVIVGLTTSGCIRASALDAVQHEFIPLVVRDAVGDRHPDVHASNLRDIGMKIADVVGLDTALSYLNACCCPPDATPAGPGTAPGGRTVRDEH